MPITIPLQFDHGKLVETNDEKESIKQFLQLLVSSYQGSFIADKDFGFSFINHRFENIHESSNKFWHSDPTSTDAIKKIRGSSKNQDTFAQDLKDAIEKYEHRLEDVFVEVTPEEVTPEEYKKYATVTIKGLYHGELITHNIELFIW